MKPIESSPVVGVRLDGRFVGWDGNNGRMKTTTVFGSAPYDEQFPSLRWSAMSQFNVVDLLRSMHQMVSMQQTQLNQDEVPINELLKKESGIDAALRLPPTSDLAPFADRSSHMADSTTIEEEAIFTAAGKIKRRKKEARKNRTTFEKWQLDELETMFELTKYISHDDRVALAERLKMTDTQVKTWFQNRRTKWRKTEAPFPLPFEHAAEQETPTADASSF